MYEITSKKKKSCISLCRIVCRPNAVTSSTLTKFQSLPNQLKGTISCQPCYHTLYMYFNETDAIYDKKFKYLQLITAGVTCYIYMFNNKRKKITLPKCFYKYQGERRKIYKHAGCKKWDTNMLFSKVALVSCFRLDC